MKKRLLIILCFLFFCIFCLIISLKVLDSIHFKCIFKYFFGIYCAGCGTTRMIKSMFSLEFYQAFRYNPFMFILSILGLIYILYMIIIYIKKEEVKIPSFKWVIVIVVLLFVYMLLRNLPGFEFLRPTFISWKKEKISFLFYIAL